MELWAGIVAGALFALIGVAWKMLNDKINDGHQEQKEQIDREVAKLWDQIGRDSNSGMRVHVHSIKEIRTGELALHDRVARLETWRNGKP